MQRTKKRGYGLFQLGTWTRIRFGFSSGHGHEFGFGFYGIG